MGLTALVGQKVGRAFGARFLASSKKAWKIKHGEKGKRGQLGS